MNAKQAARAAKKLDKQAKNPVKPRSELEKNGEFVTSDGGRENLPGEYEEKYRSENLKQRITDLGMWSMIPSVTYDMNSPAGIKRLKENDVLFTFIDQFFLDIPFAFEPNMRDGRFVLLPHNISHQGIGICASKELPGFLEIGHFWYPWEFTSKDKLNIDQVYIPQYSTKPDIMFADKIKKLYAESKNSKKGYYCTFPFDPETIVRLDGCFMDQLAKTGNTIRAALKDRSLQVQRNGEGLILFMERLMK